ncbi:MAG: two-component regulator propeller domain-containing protein, partial [Candidatus Latescibacteria bacterium]|nr:two-component regulator propeller domain-containing protein [Candidatus Latescibacterota bacterium]
MSAPPAYAIDTLQVTPTDPILEPWRWTTFDRTSAVIGDVKDVLEDRDGNIWLATDRGVQRYDGLGWTTYTAHDGLADNDVRAICQTRDGALWFGTWGAGISRFDGQTWTTYTTADGLASNFMYWPTFLEAQDGTLWAGFLAWGDRTGTNAGISQFDGKTWTTVDVPVGNPRPGIADIAEAADGTLWFTIYYGGGALRFDGQTWTQQFPGRDLNQNMVWNILSAQDGTIFFTCFREGISRFDPVTSQWQVYTPRDGLPEGTVLQNLWQTADGRIWFG